MDIERVNSLPTGDKVNLRRAFGRPPNTLDEWMAFYVANPKLSGGDASEVRKQNAFFVTTMWCFYNDKSNGEKPFVEAVAEYYKKASDSGKMEVRHLMDCYYDMHGNFLRRLASLIRIMSSMGIYVEPTDLERTLNRWDNEFEKRNRKEAIAMSIVGKPKGEQLND